MKELRDGALQTSEFIQWFDVKMIGGFADACHSLCAATTVDIGLERELVEEAERVPAARRAELSAYRGHDQT